MISLNFFLENICIVFFDNDNQERYKIKKKEINEI